jgi:hypothetical protein
MDIGVFTSTLAKDETLEWVGKPEPFKVLEGPYKKAVQRKWLIWASITVVVNALLAGLALGGVFPTKRQS